MANEDITEQMPDSLQDGAAELLNEGSTRDINELALRTQSFPIDGLPGAEEATFVVEYAVDKLKAVEKQSQKDGSTVVVLSGTFIVYVTPNRPRANVTLSDVVFSLVDPANNEPFVQQDSVRPQPRLDSAPSRPLNFGVPGIKRQYSMEFEVTSNNANQARTYLALYNSLAKKKQEQKKGKGGNGGNSGKNQTHSGGSNNDTPEAATAYIGHKISYPSGEETRKLKAREIQIGELLGVENRKQKGEGQNGGGNGEDGDGQFETTSRSSGMI